MAKGESGFKKTAANSRIESLQSLSDKIKSIDKKIQKLQDESAQVLSSRENSWDSAPPRYHEISQEIRELKNKQTDLRYEREKLRTKDEPKTTKTFVNSFGEATKREITSASYERAQRRLDKQIWSRFKGR